MATVQNRYNLVDRGSEDVLDYCDGRMASASFPGFRSPPATSPSPARSSMASPKAHDATPSQIALAWVLKRSPVMLPIPGTSKVAHLEENVDAVNITLSDQDFAALDPGGAQGISRSLVNHVHAPMKDWRAR